MQIKKLKLKSTDHAIYNKHINKSKPFEGYAMKQVNEMLKDITTIKRVFQTLNKLNTPKKGDVLKTPDGNKIIERVYLRFNKIEETIALATIEVHDGKEYSAHELKSRKFKVIK